MFVTGLIARLDTATGHVEYVCAGHEPAIVVGADGDLKKVAVGGNLPLGLDPPTSGSQPWCTKSPRERRSWGNSSTRRRCRSCAP